MTPSPVNSPPQAVNIKIIAMFVQKEIILSLNAIAKSNYTQGYNEM